MDDMPTDPIQTGQMPAGAMLIDLTPGAISASTMDGDAETFDSIGDLLQWLLDKYRMAEQGDVTHGDFLAGYSSDDSMPTRSPTAAEGASARRA